MGLCSFACFNEIFIIETGEKDLKRFWIFSCMDREDIKDYYDEFVKNKDYQSDRWFKDKASEEKYFEMKKTIDFHLDGRKFKDI